MSINISVNTSSFDNGSNVVGTINESKNQDTDNMILKELQSIQTKLNSAEKLSQSLKQLEEAIEKQNKPKIIEIVQTLTTDVSSSLLSSLASSSLLKFLGIE